ncbi:MAG: PstS family phosphate ABC transporter substrate-binding protein [Verrucomicrobiota bacterium]
MKMTLGNKRPGSNKTAPLGGFALVLLGVVAAGCFAGKADKVIIRGSNTIGEELSPRLIAEYKKEHPTVAFDLEFKGSTYGFGALMVGRCDIAAASRTVSTNELDMARSRGVAFNEYIIGEYSVAVVVNAGNLVANLTADQVRDIFTGAIQNWKDLGGPEAPIRLHIRDPISGTYLGFQELAMEKRPYALGVTTHTNYIEIIQAVGSDPQGIGYSSIDLAKSAGVKAVSIGGVVPDAAAVNKGQYPYGRVLRLYTDKARESRAATEYIQFVLSGRGQKILAEMGFVPRS